MAQGKNMAQEKSNQESKDSKDKRDPEANIIQNRMQSAIHRIFTYFFTGAGISLLNKITYPHIFYPKSSILKELGIINKAEKSPSLQREIDRIKTKKLILPKDLAQFLSTHFHTLMENEKQTVSRDKPVKISIEEIDLTLYKKEDMEYIKSLEQLKEYGKEITEKKFGKLILFGSFATRDYIKGHSDLDVAILIDKGVCSDPHKLLELRKIATKIMRESYFIDPLQHHGPYIFTEFDCEAYPQTFLPFAVWRNAVSFSGEIHLTFRERETKQEAQMFLQRYKETFLKILETKKDNLPKTSYSQKFLYQVYLLFPSVYLLARGSPCYKRESFELIKKYLTKEANELIAMFSKIRKTNAFKTVPAPVYLQRFFRAISHPFLYAIMYRITFPSDLSKERRREVEEKIYAGTKDMIDVIDQLSKKHKVRKIKKIKKIK